MKYRIIAFKGLKKIKKSGVFLFEISYFVLEIFMFLYYVTRNVVTS